MERKKDSYLALMGIPGGGHIPHWEHLSNPGFVQHMTGIDYREKPRSSMLSLIKELEQLDVIGIYLHEDDTPIHRVNIDDGVEVLENGKRSAIWDTSAITHWEFGLKFESVEDAMRYEPLKHLDMRDMYVVNNWDYSPDDEAFYRVLAQKHLGERNLDKEIYSDWFYNTMFMWPLLTFGWEKFLELAGGYEDQLKRILDDFAVINRKVFKAFAKLPINMVICHDDICMASGPVCSPDWLRRNIYPFYEEFFDMIHSGGKKIIFMCDGNIDKVADDVAACGADGFISEPNTDWKALAKKYPYKVMAGEGDNRILTYGNRQDIEDMVKSMIETAQDCAGYFMCIGNHIPWNVPPENVKLYFDLSKELGARR